MQKDFDGNFYFRLPLRVVFIMKMLMNFFFFIDSLSLYVEIVLRTEVFCINLKNKIGILNWFALNISFRTPKVKKFLDFISNFYLKIQLKEIHFS